MKTADNITGRSKVRRNPERADYSFDTISKILDDTFLCHVGFVIDNQPFVIPICYGRENDKIYFHGAKANRMLKHLRTGSEICIEVSLVNGIVLARSAFHHSVNYRSVVMFGKAIEIEDPGEKTEALKTIVEHIIPERWADVRSPNARELNLTSVFSFKIDEASVKVREGGPLEEPEDCEAKVWAGVLPLNIVSGRPERDSRLSEDIVLPGYLS